MVETLFSQNYRFRALSALSNSGLDKTIGVPSRLYYKQPSYRLPLSGKRISIADSMALQGVQMTLSSKAYAQTYPTPSNHTALFARMLINMGAVIVGKTKVSPLMTGTEWVDVQNPWNPSGDGYQSSAANSAGTGSAVSGYSWLDLAIGQTSECRPLTFQKAAYLMLCSH